MKQIKPDTIKQLRKSRCLTQEQLGVLSGMTKSQISRMENGQLGSDETVERLLSALGYSIEYTIKDNYTSSGRDKVLDILSSFKKYNAERFGIENIAIFGSVARGEQREDSDVDILISLKESSLFLLVEIWEVLKSVLKRDVDLVTEKSARERPDFFEEIEKDLIYVQ